MGGSRHPLFLLPIFHRPFSTPSMHRLPCRIQTLPRVVPIRLAAEDHTLALPDPSPLHNARHNGHAWFQPDEDPLVDRTWVPFRTRSPGTTPIRLVELVWSVWCSAFRIASRLRAIAAWRARKTSSTAGIRGGRTPARG